MNEYTGLAHNYAIVVVDGDDVYSNPFCNIMAMTLAVHHIWEATQATVKMLIWDNDNWRELGR